MKNLTISHRAYVAIMMEAFSVSYRDIHFMNYLQSYIEGNDPGNMGPVMGDRRALRQLLNKVDQARLRSERARKAAETRRKRRAEAEAEAAEAAAAAAVSELEEADVEEVSPASEPQGADIAQSVCGDPAPTGEPVGAGCRNTELKRRSDVATKAEHKLPPLQCAAGAECS